MKTLILHPTEMCHWHALVNEAQALTRLILNENTESYLVCLLMRFTSGPQLIESVIALDFLEAMHTYRGRQIELLQEIGDKSLLFCGLFPGIAKRRHLSLNYFSHMGQAAYLSVSERTNQPSREMFLQLSEQFMDLQQILQAIKTENIMDKELDSAVVSILNLPLQ